MTPSPPPLPHRERERVRGFRILVIGAYLEFGACYLVLLLLFQSVFNTDEHGLSQNHTKAIDLL
jgi:hypothetical protein